MFGDDDENNDSVFGNSEDEAESPSKSTLPITMVSFKIPPPPTRTKNTNTRPQRLRRKSTKFEANQGTNDRELQAALQQSLRESQIQVDNSSFSKKRKGRGASSNTSSSSSTSSSSNTSNSSNSNNSNSSKKQKMNQVDTTDSSKYKVFTPILGNEHWINKNGKWILVNIFEFIGNNNDQDDDEDQYDEDQYDDENDENDQHIIFDYGDGEVERKVAIVVSGMIFDKTLNAYLDVRPTNPNGHTTIRKKKHCCY